MRCPQSCATEVRRHRHYHMLRMPENDLEVLGAKNREPIQSWWIRSVGRRSHDHKIAQSDFLPASELILYI